ncbi:hypothetical protein [Photorhabdus sp. CRCIA-P01]|uniref:hypothetical protein n=1 Tax=Photorhabdus sp. CRCIA-P01 TaxID=2019570 RepID=UPI000E59FBFA|nr:hypothetical protein [Photorhabdus sp. CRCIA-P01]
MNNVVDVLSLPDWYPRAFSHLDAKEYALVCQIWQREPVLRERVAELDKYHLRGSQEKQAVKPTKHTHQVYYCHSCQCDHADYFDTPFHLIDHHLHVRLYAVLVTLWGCWCIENAIRISHCHKKSTWERYRQRLAPVLVLTSGRPVTPYPRYLLGFSPGQQGIHCPACQSSRLNYVEEMPAGNPMVHCEACQHQFVMYPDIPKGVDPFAEKTPNDQVSEPDWFRRLFAHTTQAQYQHLRCVWQREPVLRALADRLDEQNPTLGGVYECPRCGNRHVTTAHRDEYYCQFCDKTFAASVGSLFYNLQRRYYYRLYATLVLLWVQWRPTHASAIGKLRKIEVFNFYRKRLQPLLDELGDQPITPYPRYMAGFTLGRQGVHCLCCQSSNVDAVGFIVVCPDNPKIRCQDCGYEFRLQAWREI